MGFSFIYIMYFLTTAFALFCCFSSVKTDVSRVAVLEKQINELLTKLKDRTLGMLTNPTSVDGYQQPIFDRIIRARAKYNITLKCFFAPEHGLRGDHEAGRGDDDYVDAETGIQVYSLYGVRKAPTADQLKGLDLLLYDIQDVGTRFYTYIWTLTYTIESLTKAGVELFIFDRPNPLGRILEGCPLRVDSGLTGRLLPGQTFSIPIRYGLTIGEFIGYLRQYLPTVRLTVIKMIEIYDIAENEWVISSPNMPTMNTVRVYPGIGLFEDTSASQGRGTTKPFLLTGLPNIIANDILKYFESRDLFKNGEYLLRAAYFIPNFDKFVGQVCAGVEIHLMNFTQFKSVEIAMHLIKAYISVGGANMKISVAIDKMWGRVGFHNDIMTREVNDILNDCKADADSYAKDSALYWLYGKVNSILMQEQ